jgi:uncharacterized protein YceH (UPF0502 family)
MIANDLLSDVEVRVLGSLIEKAMTTPDHYPLSLNALTNACNQSSNRHPVVKFDEDTVVHAIESLRKRALVRAIKGVDSRVTKYRHLVEEKMNLDAREVAVLCDLMLRGPQTLGELKSRSSRLTPFESLAEVEAALNTLIARAESPLVVRLPRRAGQKEVRFAHLLSGEVTFDAPDPATTRVQADVDRIGALEEGMEELRKEVVDLRAQLEAFRKQFE